MYQLIKRICEDTKDSTKISLFYQNKTPHDILMKRELDILAQNHPEQLQVKYALDRFKVARGDGFEKAISAQALKGFLPDPKATPSCAVLVCGPDG